MNCEAARRAIGADPALSTAELEAHLQSCAACSQFREEMRALDAQIRRALERPPDIAPRQVRRERQPWQRWAMAASAVLASFAVLARGNEDLGQLAGEMQQDVHWLPER
jgi:anti-sigma factor RsiW